MSQEEETLDEIKRIYDRWNQNKNPFTAHDAMNDIGRIIGGAALLTGFWLAFSYALPRCLA